MSIKCIKNYANEKKISTASNDIAFHECLLHFI